MSLWSVSDHGRAIVATIDGGGINSLDEEALTGLAALLDQVAGDDGVRALVLTGAGSTFCLGLDIDLLGRAFADHHMHFGILPGGGASARLPRRIGTQQARELLLTGRWLTGPEVADYGLALRSVPGDQLREATLDLVAGLVDKPRASLGRLKQLLDDQDGLSLEDACRIEREHFRRFLEEEPLADDGYRAFVEQRAPAWQAE